MVTSLSFYSGAGIFPKTVSRVPPTFARDIIISGFWVYSEYLLIMLLSKKNCRNKNNMFLLKFIISRTTHSFSIQALAIHNSTTGWARSIRSHSSVRFCYELSGNTN